MTPLSRQAVALLEQDPAVSVAEAAFEVGIEPCTVYEAWYKTHDTPPPVGRHAAAGAGHAPHPEFVALCDVMLDHVGRTPVTARDLFEAVVDDFGRCGTRRLWRALRRLVDAGQIIKHGRPFGRTTYTRREA